MLQTPACELQTLLPLHLKRKILQELEKGCPTYANRPEKQKEIYDRYKQYLASVRQIHFDLLLSSKRYYCSIPLKKLSGMDILLLKLLIN